MSEVICPTGSIQVLNAVMGKYTPKWLVTVEVTKFIGFCRATEAIKTALDTWPNLVQIQDEAGNLDLCWIQEDPPEYSI